MSAFKCMSMRLCLRGVDSFELFFFFLFYFVLYFERMEPCLTLSLSYLSYSSVSIFSLISINFCVFLSTRRFDETLAFDYSYLD